MDEPELLARVVRDPAILAGEPTLRGKRLAVADVLAMLGSGHRIEDVLAANPNLELDDIRACLFFALKQIPGAIKLRGPTTDGAPNRRPDESGQVVRLDYERAEPPEKPWPIAGHMAATCLAVFIVTIVLDESRIRLLEHHTEWIEIECFLSLFAGTFISVFAVCKRRRRTVWALIAFFGFVSIWFYDWFVLPGWP